MIFIFAFKVYTTLTTILGFVKLIGNTLPMFTLK